MQVLIPVVERSSLRDKRPRLPARRPDLGIWYNLNMKKHLVWLIALLVIILGGIYLLTSNGSQGEFCGGLIGDTCGFGYVCKYEGNYPDAGGECVNFFSRLFSK